MLSKTQKSCKVKAVIIIMMTLLLSGLVVGCSTSPESSEQNNRNKDQEIELQRQMDQEQNNRYEQDNQAEDKAEDQAFDGHTAETEVQKPSDGNENPVEARVMIRSNNQITISSQEVLEQLDKEIEHLLKSLDNMDSISDEQLDF